MNKELLVAKLREIRDEFPEFDTTLVLTPLSPASGDEAFCLSNLEFDNAIDTLIDFTLLAKPVEVTEHGSKDERIKKTILMKRHHGEGATEAERRDWKQEIGHITNYLKDKHDDKDFVLLMDKQTKNLSAVTTNAGLPRTIFFLLSALKDVLMALNSRDHHEDEILNNINDILKNHKVKKK